MNYEIESNNKLSMILAISKNGVIGNNGKVPWKIPEDMKHFKHITSYHPVIMGRKTFEDIGHPLMNRHNIVISRNKNLKLRGINGVDVVNSFEEAIEMSKLSGGETIVIGGAEIYKMALPFVTKIYLTEILYDVNGDTKFEFDRSEFIEISRIEGANKDIVFVTLERK